jgi:energy-coupling factor transport system permease protein
VWAIAAAASVQLAPNPLYVVLVLAISFLVVSAHRLDTTLARAFPILVGLGVAFALLRVGLTALTTHSPTIDGPPPHLLFTLPSGTLPRILGGFTVGGTIEGDVVAAAAAQAFAVVGILGAFGAFNAVASHHELVASTPRAFHEPGLIVSVALAFVPSTMAAVGAAREADRARTGGRVVRRGRLVRLAVPIVESGLERAMALAESMDARGFARQRAGRSDRVAGWLGLVGMLGLSAGFLGLVGRNRAATWGGAVVGLAALAAAVLVAGRAPGRTRYRPRTLTRVDGAVVLASLAAPAGLGILSSVFDRDLFWSVTPLRFPPFSPLAALCLAMLAAPALVAPARAGAAAPQPAAGAVDPAVAAVVPT